MSRHGVEGIVIGGVAASAHGSTRFTQGVDLLYRRTPENIARLVQARAAGIAVSLGRRDGPARAELTLTTSIGFVGFFREVTGGGVYDDLLPFARPRQAFGIERLVVERPKLIALQRAAGRPKNFEAIAKLELILEEGGGN